MTPSQRLSRGRKILPWALGLTLILPLAARSAQAQSQPAAQDEQATLNGRTLSVDFPGGTLLDFVHAVQKAAGGLNVIAPPGSETVRLGPASLKNVTPYNALEAARAI